MITLTTPLENENKKKITNFNLQMHDLEMTEILYFITKWQATWHGDEARLTLQRTPPRKKNNYFQFSFAILWVSEAGVINELRTRLNTIVKFIMRQYDQNKHLTGLKKQDFRLHRVQRNLPCHRLPRSNRFQFSWRSNNKDKNVRYWKQLNTFQEGENHRDPHLRHQRKLKIKRTRTNGRRCRKLIFSSYDDSVRSQPASS